jgi:hypothetical protein
MVFVAALLIVASAVIPAYPVAAQSPGGAGVRVEVGVDPARVRIGEPFRSAVRVIVPVGETVEIGEFVSGDSLAAAAPAEVGRDDEGAATAVFSLVAWISGERLAASVPVRLVAADGSARSIAVPLRLPEVISVRPPADGGEEVAPRPPRGVIPLSTASPFPWWWVVFLLAVLALAIVILARWYARREPTEVGVVITPNPRDWALAQLGEDGAAGLLASRDLPALITHVSRVVRTYMSRVAPELGADLTSAEVVTHLDREGGGRASIDLHGILAIADRVKFARHRPTMEEAEDLLASARAWVSTYHPEGSARGPGPDGDGPGGPEPGGRPRSREADVTTDLDRHVGEFDSRESGSGERVPPGDGRRAA